MQIKRWKILLLLIIPLFSGCLAKGALTVMKSGDYPAVKKSWYKKLISRNYGNTSPVILKNLILSILSSKGIFPAVIPDTGQKYLITAEYVKDVFRRDAQESGENFLCFVIEWATGSGGITLDIHYCIINTVKFSLFWQYKLLHNTSLDKQAEAFLGFILEELDKELKQA